MKFRAKPVKENRVELIGDFDMQIVTLDSVNDDEGGLRVVATFDAAMAKDIIDGLAILYALRSATKVA